MIDLSVSKSPEDPDVLMRKYSEFARATSDAGEEVSRGTTLDYDRVAARFYEEQIIRLRGEVKKYRDLAQSAVTSGFAHRVIVFDATETTGISVEFKNKMCTPAEGADYTPEEL